MNVELIITLTGTVVGVLLTALVGMVLSEVKGLRVQVMEIDRKVFVHLTHPDIHQSAVARIDQQLKDITSTVQMAHDRLDRVENSS